MAYTTPRTWVTDETVTASIMNTYIRDNQSALKDPPSDDYTLNEGSDYTTTSTSFADVDATNLALTITTTGGDVMVHFHGTFKHSVSGSPIYLEVDVDGSPEAGDDGIIAGRTQSTNVADLALTFTRLITGLSAASHTFKLQWKVNAGTATLYAGAGTGTGDVHPQFWVREMS